MCVNPPIACLDPAPPPVVEPVTPAPPPPVQAVDRYGKPLLTLPAMDLAWLSKQLQALRGEWSAIVVLDIS